MILQLLSSGTQGTNRSRFSEAILTVVETSNSAASIGAHISLHPVRSHLKGRSFPQPGLEVFRRPWNRSLNSVKGLKGRPSLHCLWTESNRMDGPSGLSGFLFKMSPGPPGDLRPWLGELLARWAEGPQSALDRLSWIPMIDQSR